MTKIGELIIVKRKNNQKYEQKHVLTWHERQNGITIKDLASVPISVSKTAKLLSAVLSLPGAALSERVNAESAFAYLTLVRVGQVKVKTPDYLLNKLSIAIKETNNGKEVSV